MTHLPTIINDLAMILLVAGVTTILFKKINQPLVLGYIVAGFITGPHFNFFPTITDKANVHAWSEIGVIFLLFALGLEFSFYKLKSVGSTAFIATAVEIGGMLAVGYFAGTLLGWNHMDSLFLGGMLSMSSTTIIIKAFDDLKLRAQRFTEIVFGVLIIEDIAGIVMMVLLATMAVASADVSTMELLLSIGRLIFFLVLWFVLGMYLVPSFFKWAKQLMNEETLVVVSIGLCLGMVVLATQLGFSSALGAFIMGSLIAEAPNAEKSSTSLLLSRICSALSFRIRRHDGRSRYPAGAGTAYFRAGSSNNYRQADFLHRRRAGLRPKPEHLCTLRLQPGTDR